MTVLQRKSTTGISVGNLGKNLAAAALVVALGAGLAVTFQTASNPVSESVSIEAVRAQTYAEAARNAQSSVSSAEIVSNQIALELARMQSAQMAANAGSLASELAAIHGTTSAGLNDHPRNYPMVFPEKGESSAPNTPTSDISNIE